MDIVCGRLTPLWVHFCSKAVPVTAHNPVGRDTDFSQQTFHYRLGQSGAVRLLIFLRSYVFLNVSQHRHLTHWHVALQAASVRAYPMVCDVA